MIPVVIPGNLGDEFDVGNQEPNLITLLLGEWLTKKASGEIILSPAIAEIKSDNGGQNVTATPSILNLPQSFETGSPNLSISNNAIRVNKDGFALISWVVGFTGGNSTSRTCGFHELLRNGNTTLTYRHTYHRTRTNVNLGSACFYPRPFKVAAGDIFQIRSRRKAGIATLTALPGENALCVWFFEV